MCNENRGGDLGVQGGGERRAAGRTGSPRTQQARKSRRMEELNERLKEREVKPGRKTGHSAETGTEQKRMMGISEGEGGGNGRAVR